MEWNNATKRCPKLFNNRLMPRFGIFPHLLQWGIVFFHTPLTLISQAGESLILWISFFSFVESSAFVIDTLQLFVMKTFCPSVHEASLVRLKCRLCLITPPSTILG